MKFRLRMQDDMGNRVGRHCVGPIKDRRWARVVLPGEIIESDLALDELFKNKFERVSDGDPKPMEPVETEPKSNPIEQVVRTAKRVLSTPLSSAGPKGKRR